MDLRYIKITTKENIIKCQIPDGLERQSRNKHFLFLKDGPIWLKQQKIPSKNFSVTINFLQVSKCHSPVYFTMPVSLLTVMRLEITYASFPVWRLPIESLFN